MFASFRPFPPFPSLTPFRKGKWIYIYFFLCFPIGSCVCACMLRSYGRKNSLEVAEIDPRSGEASAPPACFVEEKAADINTTFNMWTL